MYQHILLAVALQRWDKPSPHALAARDAAVALANGAGARLSVLSVYEYEDLDVPDLAARGARPLPRSPDAAHRRAHGAEAEDLPGRRADRWLAVTPVLKLGEPRPLILRTAESLGVDLLVIGAHSKRSFLDVLLGGTAAYVSRHAPCSVVMVQPEPEGKSRT